MKLNIAEFNLIMLKKFHQHSEILKNTVRLSKNSLFLHKPLNLMIWQQHQKQRSKSF